MTEIPRPGQKVRGSRTGAPIMALFDLLGRRWAMGVLWTLCISGPLTFRELQELCEGISPAVLNQRLKELQMAGFVGKTSNGYAASEFGECVYRQLVPLGETARAWGKLLDEREQDVRKQATPNAPLTSVGSPPQRAESRD